MLNLETPNPLGAMAVATIPIPDGDAGTEATIAAMRRLIEQGKKDPAVRELALHIITQARIPGDQYPGSAERKARALYESVKRNMRFTKDITGKETLHAAPELIRLRCGDCDDFTVLLCSLYESVGLRTRIVTIAGDERAPEIFSHVFPEVRLCGRWTPADAARRNPSFGRHPSRAFRRREWDTETGEFIDVQGLNGLETRYLPNQLPKAWRGGVTPGWAQQLGGPVLAQNGRRRLGAFASTYGAPQGYGRYGRPAVADLALGELGDFNWSALTNAITGATTGVANIITAERAAPTNLYPTTAVPQGAPAPYASLLTPAGTAYSSFNPTWLLLGGGALLAVVLLARGRR